MKLDVREDCATLLLNEVVLQEMGIDKRDVIRAREQEAAGSQSAEPRSHPRHRFMASFEPRSTWNFAH